MTLEVKDKKQLERVVSAIRRISGVRDIERVQQPVSTLVSRARAHRDFQIQRDQDRLERRPSQRICARLSARRMPLRDMHRRARNGAAEVELFGAAESVSDVQADAEDAERGGSGQLRDPDRMVRRAQHRDLFVRSFAADLPVRGVPIATCRWLNASNGSVRKSQTVGAFNSHVATQRNASRAQQR